MTTAVPTIYSFPEFSGVAEAVADLIITAQNRALHSEETHGQSASIGGGSGGAISSTNITALASSSQNMSQIESSQNSSGSASATNLPSLDSSQRAGATPLQQQADDTGDIHRHHHHHHHHHHRHASEPEETSGDTDTGGASGSSPLKKSSSGSSTHGGSSAASAALRRKKKAENRRFRISISGGSLISVLHEGLLKRDDVEWGKWDIYFADERLVPFDHPESNYGKAKRQLLDLIDSDAKGYPSVYPIEEALITDPQECADSYENTLIKGFASKDSVRLPLFDIFLLGCAPDGHVASLFPNQETLRESCAWCVPVEDAPSGPKQRITMTVPVICHSHMVAFVVEGATKAPVIKTIMERPDKGLPASIINEQVAGRIAWFVDDEAVKDVVGITKKRYKFTAPSE